MILKNSNRDKNIGITSLAPSFTVFVPSLSVLFANCLKPYSHQSLNMFKSWFQVVFTSNRVQWFLSTSNLVHTNAYKLKLTRVFRKNQSYAFFGLIFFCYTEFNWTCLVYLDANSHLGIAIFLSCGFFSLYGQDNFVSTKSKCKRSCKCKLVHGDSTEFDVFFESLHKWFFYCVFSSLWTEDIP